MKRAGLTPFTYSRFLVPYLCDYKGWALFIDVDMLVRTDISELWDMRDARMALMASKNTMKFERASLMLFNNELCDVLTPQYVETANDLHSLGFLPDHLVGDLPREWNHLVGYDEPRPDAKLVHFTQGVPMFPETKDCEYAEEWKKYAQTSVGSVPWSDLMGNSVHAKPVLDRLKTKAA
jgi:hypothetical protein